MQIKLKNIKFICSYTSSGTTHTQQVFPLLTTGKVDRKREDYHVITNFNGDLTFINSKIEGVFDFDLIKSIEQADISTKISIDVYVDNVLKHEGYFYPFSCQWDNDRCTCIVKLITDDVYTCLNKYMDTQENIIEGVVPFGPYHVVGEPTMAVFECEEVHQMIIEQFNPVKYVFDSSGQISGTIGNGLPYYWPALGYGPPPQPNLISHYPDTIITSDHCLGQTYNLNANNAQVLRIASAEYTLLDTPGITMGWYEWGNIGFTNYGYKVDVKVKTTWIAEKIITVDINGSPSSPGPSWQQWKPFALGNIAAHVWLREPYYNNQNYAYHLWVNQNTYQKFTLINPYQNNPNYDFNVFSGRKVTDILSFFLQQSGCGLTLQSDFLTNWVNPVTGELGNLNYLSVTPCKDIKAAGTTTDIQLILKMSMKDLLDELTNRLNCHWYIDTANNHFVIEHQMYFDLGYTYNTSVQVTKDITGIINNFTGKQEIVKTNKYTYAVDKIYNREKFIESLFANADFYDRVIKYNIQADQNEKEYRCNFITDLSGIIEYPSRFGDEQPVLLSLQYNAALNMHEPINEPGYRTGDMVLNGHLCLSNTIPKYWYYGRMFLSGTIDGDQTTFLSVIKKLLQTLSVKDCNDDIDFENLVKTNLETGEIVAMNWDIITRVKELTVNV
ncbi:MAG: hypothetical protein PHU98_06150 [Mariniphaga sp.]|nr:hypothetical protein [Paludibacter sp.]MDD4225952.1 hypothetical protein [Mariniphaga sp.]